MNKKILYLLISLISISGQAQLEICNNGFAGSFPCNDYDLMDMITLQDMSADKGNDVWGWTDPQTNLEYAIVGLNNGTAFIDITDPTDIIYLGKLPTHTSNSTWRDIKVYNNYAFIVSEASGHGMQVFDLTKLRNASGTPQTFAEDAHYAGFGNCHNLVINESKPIAYAVGTSTFNGGPHFVDISNPLNPQALGGYDASFYSHDAQVVTYNGPDNDYLGREIFVGSNEVEVVFVDVTQPSNPQLISTISYVDVAYTHQGWLTEDAHYFILNDELDEINFGFNTRTLIFDVSDLDNPFYDFNYTGPTPAVDHNYYTKGNNLFLSNYTAGIRIVDITNIVSGNVSEVGFFDSYPSDDNVGFNGVWSNYPYFASTNIAVSDINTGFFLIRKSGTFSTNSDELSRISFYPNPTNDILYFKNAEGMRVDNIKFYNVLGQGVLEVNKNEITNNAIDISAFAEGVYHVMINDKISKKIIKK